MRFHVFGFLCLFSLIWACPVFAQKASTVPKEEPSSKAPKGEVLEGTSSAGKAYWYRLPKSIPKGGVNLVFMFHGTGLTYPWAFWNYPIASGQFRGDDIVVAPEGMTPGRGKSFNFSQGAADEDQIVALIKRFRGKFKIKRVYLYGHSQGAFFTYWFAGQQPQLVDGFVAHAGNVLGNVKHGAFAKKSMAVGILHGRADAVVTVECATRTAKIYRDLGYAQVKLEIVEGLTARSGHWPLPIQVAAMFDWLDNATTSSAASAMIGFAEERAKKKPSVATLVLLLKQSERLFKKHKGSDKKKVSEEIVSARQFVDELSAKVVGLCDEHAVDPKRKTDQLGHALFRQGHGLLGGHRAWEKGIGAKRLSAGKKAEKKIQKARKIVLAKWNKKSRAVAEKTLMTCQYGTSYLDLVHAVNQALTSHSAGLSPDKLKALKERLQESLAHEKNARELLSGLVNKPGKTEK
ncbi:MAG: putative esterase [Planctomycetota bacterium]|jgi:predicted esterase